MQHLPNYPLPIHCNDWPGRIINIIESFHIGIYGAHDIQFIPTKIITSSNIAEGNSWKKGPVFELPLFSLVLLSCTTYPPQWPSYFCCTFHREGLSRGPVARRSFLGCYSWSRPKDFLGALNGTELRLL